MSSYKNSIKTLRQLLLILTMISMILFGIRQHVVAAETYLDLQLSSSAKLVEASGKEKELSSAGPIAYGSTVRLRIQVANRSGTLDTQIRVFEKEGVAFKPYAQGVLSIDGKKATQSEYQALLKSGLSMQLNQVKHVIELDVTTTGSSRNKISVDTQVRAQGITVGDATETYEHSFQGSFAFPANQMHKVRVYDGATLLQTHHVEHNKSLSLNGLHKDGHVFLGFNLESDGSANFYQGQPITSDLNLYTTYRLKQYLVSYYIDNVLYEQRIVNHGESAENILDPQQDNRVFVGWSLDLSRIVEDTVVFALFTDSERPLKALGVSYRLDEIKEGSHLTLYDDEIIASAGTFSYDFVTSLKMRADVSLPFRIAISAIPFIVSLLLVALFIMNRRRKKGGIHE
ncbi:hypothetical protein M2093_000002 [Breznakia sp. PH1-1]|nr:hypothetical protein [Breznakia sp. PH1-1]MDH6403208.1 hypothetical protein [Breznakia sp. PF1-11]MDH6410917.1 hypothetical protein [Breznakia sp. PFB1-11]MDH6415394.1 hypothetical protein [Breznakia sp. PFB1-4]MDH6417693.1 hypothetical protein [Breznakia sp. PFB1-12]MDH6473088.1 hypothetical protein [Breznakia sp. PFB2-30]MDH6475134.1 hypothetical protein [Breznakia sp. PFB1-19]